MVIQPDKIELVKDMVRVEVLSFLANNISPKYLTNDEQLFLKKHGIDYANLSEPQETAFSLAYKFAMYANNTNFDKAKNVSLHQFKQILQSGKFLPLSKREQESLDFINYKNVSDIKNYQQTILSKIEQSIQEANTKLQPKYEKVINNAAEQAILKRQGAKEFASELRKKTGDLTRDWLRVSNYIQMAAHQQGVANEIERLYGADALVYKHVYPQACKHCFELFTEKKTGKPIVFKLSELKENGTNIGRKVKDWKPVIGALHPFCLHRNTQILTNKGWLYFYELIGDELILSINKENSNGEWVTIKNIIKYNYKGKLHEFKNNIFNICSTPDHDHLIKYKDKFVVCKDFEIPKYAKFVKTIPNWIGESPEFIEIGNNKFDTKLFIEFMAYYLSDGSISFHEKGKWQIKLTQQKNNINSHYKELKECSEKLFNIVWCGEHSIQIPIKDNSLIDFFKSFGKCNEKFIPEFIKNTSKEYLEIFLKAYSISDGYVGNKKYEYSRTSYFTTSDKMMSDLSEIILKSGMAVSFYLMPIKTTKFKNGEYTSNYPIWVIRQNKLLYPAFKEIKKIEIDYDDMVYCVELNKNNNFAIKYNNKVSFTNNCRCTLVDIPPFYKWDDDKKAFAPKIDKEANLKFIKEYQDKLRKLKQERGDIEFTNIDELRKGINTYMFDGISKGLKPQQMLKEFNESHKIILSDYKAVNEIENDFNLSFLKVLGSIVDRSIVMVIK